MNDYSRFNLNSWRKRMYSCMPPRWTKNEKTGNICDELNYMAAAINDSNMISHLFTNFQPSHAV